MSPSDDNTIKTLNEILEKYHRDSNELLQILLEAQTITEKNYISEEMIDRIAEELKISKARVNSVITFYDALSDKPRGKYIINLCQSTTCSLWDNKRVVLDWIIKELGIHPGETTEDQLFTLNTVSCFGACDISPNVRINHSVFGHLTEEKMKAILSGIRNSEKSNELLKIQPDRSHKKTVSIITSNFGKYDGYNIEEYIHLRGFESFRKALDMGYEAAANEITQAGIKGRGGAEYPAGIKLLQSREAIGERKFVVCNADEGEPGTFKDRELLKNDPYKVIEGMLIASYIADAREGIIYLREEYSWLRSKIQHAIDCCYEKGYLGKGIGNSAHDFELRIFSGGGSYVCGEGFALCESLEGKPGKPRIKPPFVKQAGYLQYPTLIMNVETLSAVASFLKDGSQVFTSIGTPDSPGSKVISISGKVARPGVYEIPFGLTLQEIIKDIAGGMMDGEGVGFIQVGGASGGIIPNSLLDTVYDYKTFKKIGTSVGSGALVVGSHKNNILDYLRVVQEFFAHESCGKCTPCREGNVQLHHLLERFSKGIATEVDIERYRAIVNALEFTSLCGSGKTEAVPLKTALLYFKDIFMEKMI
ncbi:MAG: NAD(P)H-dependent oxidoreductase subunit E [Peptostreptococcales bacterium]